MAGSPLNGVEPAPSNGQNPMTESRSASEQSAPPIGFSAVNKQSINQRDSNGPSRNSSARASPQVDPAPASKPAQISQAPATESATSNGQTAQPGALDPSGSYGTRSRRTGNQRLNYAEDQDMEFEFTSAATTTSSKKATASSSAANAQSTNAPEAKRAKESANSTSVNGSAPLTHSSANHVAKEAVAGTSNATTNPKKRKAAGTPSTATATPPAAAGAPSGAGNMRKSAVVPSVLARDTNMMTFTKSRACLNKKGELSADDGTKLAVNGKYMRRVSLLTFSKWRSQPYPEPRQSLRTRLTRTHRSRVPRLRTPRRAILSLSSDGVPACGLCKSELTDRLSACQLVLPTARCPAIQQ